MTKRLSTEEFVTRAGIIHKNKYDYSDVTYVSSHSKINIICNIHGKFTQTPSDHLTGRGCFDCAHTGIGLKSRKSHDEYILLAKNNHNNKYDYSLIQNSRPEDKVDIICPEHGKFTQIWRNHIHGKGCINCAGVSKSTITKFIERANCIHNNRYDYSLSEYANANISLIIICPVHGQFLRTPYNHVNNKSGCEKCSANSSKVENQWLDALGVPAEFRQYKLCIAGKNIKTDAYNPITNTVYEFWGDLWHGNPKLYNSNNINQRNGKTFGELFNKTEEKRHLILNAGYKLVEIWENDFNLSKKGNKNVK